MRVAPVEVGVTPESRPHHVAGTASLWLGDELLLANSSASSPVTLDPVSAVVYSSLDGSATVDDLADDLHLAIGGDIEERRRQVAWLVGALAQHAVASWDGCTAAPLPRSMPVPIDPASCLGQSIGLGDGELLQVRDSDGRIVRFGSTHLELLESLIADVRPEPIDVEPAELLFLRASISQGRSARRHYVVDDLGNRLFASWDLDRAVETMERLVRSRLDDSDEPRIQALALRGEAGFVLVHPSLHEAALDALRCASLDDPELMVPAVGFRLGAAAEAEAVGGPPLSGRIAAVVLPRTESSLHRLRLLVHLARRWDNAHLAAVAELAAAVDLVEVEHELSLERLEAVILRSANPSDPTLDTM